MRALGAYIFAGGFTLGVRRHFDVRCHLEGDSYGVATVKHNMPELPVYHGPERWPLAELRREPWDLVYGNPPCAPWSQAGGVVHGRDWREDPRVDCVRRHFGLLEELRPTVWVWESVPRAFTAGQELIRDLTERAQALGYAVTYLFQNAKWLGAPQNRPRFFFVAHRVRLTAAPVDFTAPLTPAEVLGRMNDIGEQTWTLRPDLVELLPDLKAGKRLVELWDARHPPETAERNAQGRLRGRPPFGWHRCPWDRPANAVVGAMTVHPREDRLLTVKELAALCGFPPDYEFVGSGQNSLIARGVCPPVGEWLARGVRESIEAGEPTAPVVELVDLREPPGERRPWTWEEPVLETPRERPEEARRVLPPVADIPPARLLDVKPKEGLGSGAYIRLLLSMARYTPAQIVELVHRHYPGSKATTKDVYWNKRKLLQDQGQAQPTRKAATHVDAAREYDKSALTESGYGYRVHRDYAAHFFRWGWTFRFIDKTMDVLEVGCGVDTPLVRALMSDYGGRQPGSYVGVDLNKLKRAPARPWTTFHEEFNFNERHGELGDFDVIVNFEVIEHMTVEHGRTMLRAFKQHLRPGGTLLLSTPVFDGKAAANHIHEYTVPELRAEVEAAGFYVAERYGTFANARELKKVATPEQLATLEGINRFYSTDVTACFLAPLYPDASRNNVWVLRHREHQDDD
jgi:DNA (cytosine-5)-methyltransferase 1